MIRTLSQNKIKILTWNTQGLQHKIPELEEFLISNQIDIACIQETLLNPKLKIHIPNYIFLRRDRKKRDNEPGYIGRGIGIFIKQGFKFNIIPPPPTPSDMESFGIKIFHLNDQNYINIFSIYTSKKIKTPDLDLF